ncbi:hypothetical protein [Massilia agri]|uniref:Relaxase/mobilization nuclease domain-containing protein n=1 Tax=Massilia agri TaxID=1886785 RepID=A0ABT2ANA8_9BURK|nr:hypothetical protein [Massilia agri]MCS0597722.1 hypothetical protein [Massilia agri]
MPKASIEYPSIIVNRNGNNGWHKKGKRAYRNAVLTILQFLQTAKEPRLYHLCFEGKSHRQQMKMLKALVQMADRAGINCEWFAARETADRTKVDHLHVFMVIDAYGIKVAKLFNQFDDGQVAQLCAKHGVNFSIFSPKDDLGIHGNNTYMALPYQGPGNRETELGRKRLADALTWLTYNYKARSKPTEEEADGQIFPSSRPTRKRKNPLLPAALPAAEEIVAPITETKGDELTPAERYVGTRYEEAVDAGLDVEALRLYLLSKGIPRTPAQVRYELDEVYGFHQYASQHPAPAQRTYAEIDAHLGREKPSKVDRVVTSLPVGSRQGTVAKFSRDRALLRPLNGRIIIATTRTQQDDYHEASRFLHQSID